MINIKLNYKYFMIGDGSMDKNYQIIFPQKATVEVREVEMPQINDDQVLIKTLVSQISTGTELTRLMANVDETSAWNKDIIYPVYPGYSNVGEIVAVGKNLDQSWLGRRVLTANYHVKYSIPNLDEDFYFIPDNVDSDEAVFGVIAQVTLGSIRAAKIKLGETVAVFGAGLIGHFVSRFAKLAGALNVVVVDTSDFRLGLIPKEKGFITVNSSRENVADVIKKVNDGKLANIVFETTGVQSLAQSEAECVHKNGKLIITSSPRGSSFIDFDYCSRMGITIIGAHNYTMHPLVETDLNPWTRWADSKFYIKLLEQEYFSVKNLITHRASFRDAKKMYDMLYEDRSKAMGVHLYWED